MERIPEKKEYLEEEIGDEREDTEIGVRWVYRQSVSQSRQMSFVNYFHSPPVVFISY